MPPISITVQSFSDQPAKERPLERAAAWYDRGKRQSCMTAQRAVYSDRIVADPAIMAGKPVVKGTRIPVETVLRVLSLNPDLDELFADYPRLTLDDVRACLAYAEALVAGAEVMPAPKPRSRARRRSQPTT